MKIKIKPNPDFGRIEKVLLRQGKPDRIPFYELFSNIQQECLACLGIGEKQPDKSLEDEEYENWYLREHVKYMYNLGYDYLNIGGKNFVFPKNELPTTETKEGTRGYYLASSSTINNREDFEKYKWPKTSDIDYSLFEKIRKITPDGMKIISGFSGVLENVMWLTGYEGISFMLYEDKQLVKDMFEEVGKRIIAYFDNIASIDEVGAIVMGDDMGFKTQTMLSAKDFREYLFPWHKKLVDTIHKHNKPVILHACGNLTEVMDDIIACGWDAKHSFEDEIEPVWEVKQKYGKRITLLGGFDMNKICMMNEYEVRKHTRFLIEKCAANGGWALGTGNSVANYIPVKNFLTMLEEGFIAGVY